MKTSDNNPRSSPRDLLFYKPVELGSVDNHKPGFGLCRCSAVSFFKKGNALDRVMDTHCFSTNRAFDNIEP